MRSISLALVAVAALCGSAPRAQPARLGAADDPFELGTVQARAASLHAAVYGGPAYLDAWRGAVRAEADVRAGRLSLGLGTTLHPAAGGLYGPEADDLYDVLRVLRYARLDPAPGSPVYVRVGPVERLTLGVGTLVRGVTSAAAWDERTVGVEASARAGRVTLSAFTDDVRLGGLVGGEVGVRTRARVGPLGRLRGTLAGVHDVGGSGLSGDGALTGAELSVRGDLLGDATFGVGPYATAAHVLGGGTTLGGGLAAEADRLGEVLRASARVGLTVSSAGALDGLVGPFYALNNGRDRIVVADSYYDAEPGVSLAGTPRDSLGGGADLTLDLRAVVFGRAEVAQYVRRHIGPDRASAYGARLAGRFANGARVELAVERQGFRGIWALLFGSLDEENTLVLDVGVPVGPAHLFVRSRYGYRRLPEPEVGPGRFLIERRFEPLVGVRVVR